MTIDANLPHFQRIRAKLLARAWADEAFKNHLVTTAAAGTGQNDGETPIGEAILIQRPAFKPTFHIETVKGEGIFLLSEQGHFVLTGPLNELVVPLIDGLRTADEIADLLGDQLKMEDAYYALALLEREGYLVEVHDSIAEGDAAFWAALDVDSREAREGLAAAHIVLHTLGRETAAPRLREALQALGLSSSTTAGEKTADLLIVIADDYLQPELESINREQLASGQPWMLCKPGGLIFWVGPLFMPPRTACWQCLAQRLHSNRHVESFLEKKGHKGPFPVATSRTPSSIQQAVHTAAQQAAIFIASGANDNLYNHLLTTNLVTGLSEKHTLQKRPQCPACGSPECYFNNKALFSLQTTNKTMTQDGGYRTVSPDTTWQHYREHISPITGIMSSIRPATDLNSGPLRVYVAGHNLALKDDSLFFLRQGLRSKSLGKGRSDVQARTSALCEAIERYSGVYRGQEKIVQASYRELGDAAIHPHACMLFSDQQYRQRQRWLDRSALFQRVPLPFPEDVIVDWTPVYSLKQGDSKYVPSGYLYYNYPMADDAFFYWADSNGNAAGNTIEEAILQGFLELIERDAVCIWWYNRLRRPAVDLSSLEDGYITQLQTYYSEQGRQFWVLDLTADTGIPAFAAISRCLDSEIEDIVMGFGAHLNARVAIMRAITEMNQFMPAVLGRLPSGETRYTSSDPESRNWWQNATLANQPYLQPSATEMQRHVADFAKSPAGAVQDAVQFCVDAVAHLGLEMLVLDQTQPDIGLPVVKVIVPGLRHFWARFAPGRLYDVPVKMGWLARPVPEDGLNPIPIFL